MTSVDANPLFQHHPLDPSSRQIRLVRFVASHIPGEASASARDRLVNHNAVDDVSNIAAEKEDESKDEVGEFGGAHLTDHNGQEGNNNSGPTINMSIEHYDFDEAPPYLALSYSWGPPPARQAIRLNNRMFPVRQNLWDFLQVAVARFQTSQLLWIDQLCIDQTKEKEKNQQVQFMGDIYRRADHVVAWLGPEGEDAVRAKELYTYMRGRGNRHMGFPLEWGDEFLENLKQANRFHERAYFSRLWVIQELALARRVNFLCGTIEFDWDDFRHEIFGPELCKLALAYAELDRRFGKPYEVVWSFYQAKVSWQCTVRLDRVYAIMGLVPEHNRPVVDYAKSQEALFSELLDSAVDDLVLGYLTDSNRYLDKALYFTGRTVYALCTALDMPRPATEEVRKMWDDRLAFHGVAAEERARLMRSDEDWKAFPRAIDRGTGEW